ncbi:RagB/SusD family nutrient uptake outer membrane protein [Sphingobacterium sp. SG20118]|uniref:RagB/SusD family nutrient uptake outer membrane protein n=1 Tax=Sphingobacterium sp. SG20118 TaxID=3367156 RepID=UPI0037DFC95E
MKVIQNTLAVILAAVVFNSCNDKLDMAPESSITPENYLWDESQLAAYTVNRYNSFPVNGEINPFAGDNATDVQASQSVPASYVTGEYRVPLTGGAWEFSEIYNINYFLKTVLPRYKENKITGNPEMVKHYIGEMYFFRALQYFGKLTSLGDFPILKTILPDDRAALIEASKRLPRTEVARFIISDLDSAITLMKNSSPDGKNNRLSQKAAQLFKSRVALFEGTWLKYFKNTPFVPNGPDWPGATKDYNKNYQFQSGNIDNEINWFLDQAIESADQVASASSLTPNSGVLPQNASESNAYVEMFGNTDMSGYDEVLLWKAYNRGLGITNNIPVNSSTSNLGIGITKGMVDSYLMKNGLPIYAAGSGYHGDESIADVRKDRDQRAYLFLKEPNQINMWINLDQGSHGAIKEPFLPNITSGSSQFRYNTGYTSRKGVNPDKSLADNWGGSTGYIIFRSAEAYLNYLEAYYERHGSVGGKMEQYWKALRKRAGVDVDINKTIQATDMSIEAKGNWSAYSANKLIDKTLFNIRRERSAEFLGEGFRERDLRRWRSMDQLITNKFHIEGFKIWGNFYKNEYEKAGQTDLTYKLVYGITNTGN